MPLFLCRWPNGDCSVVLARTRAEAIERLDEIDNAEGCPIERLEVFQAHFSLGDDGQLTLSGWGEETAHAVFASCYPALDAVDLNDETAVKAAVKQERQRVQISQSTIEQPDTEIGRRVKQQTGMPTTLVNTLVKQTGRKHLKHLPIPRKPH